jgi:hypothetical protein
MNQTEPRKKKPACGAKPVTGSTSAMKAGLSKTPAPQGGTKVR